MGLIKHNAQADLALESLLIWEFEEKSNTSIVWKPNGWITVCFIV